MCQIIMILCINSMRMEFQSLESGDPEKKNIAELVKGLKDETASVREESVKKLEKMGPDAYGALGVLVELFKDPNMAVRNSASVAVARIGPRAVPVLCESLGNADDEVRASAAYALAVMGPSANRAVPLLIKTLEKDRNESVRGNVISALGAIGDEKAIPALIRTLRGDSSENIRSDAARVLGRFEKNAKEVVPALIAAINIEPKRHAFETVVDWSVVRFNGDELVAFWAVLSLSGFGFAEISPVLQVIKDPSFRGREFAIQALREFVRSYQQEKRQGDTTRSGDFKIVILVLVEAMKDNQERIRLASILALDEMEKEAKDALPAINRCLQDRSAQIQIAAAGAAYRISGNAKPSVAVLSQFIKDPNPDIRTYACRELREFQGDASPAVPQLIEALKDPDMREDSISVLGSIGPGAKTAIPALRKLVEMGLGADEVADAIRQIEGK